MTPWAWLEITTCFKHGSWCYIGAGSRAPQPPRRVVDGSRAAVYQMNQIRPLERGVLCTYQLLRTRCEACDTHHPLQTPNCDGKFYRFGFGWMVVRFVRVIRVPACARVSRVSRVCPGSPRCLSTGTGRVPVSVTNSSTVVREHGQEGRQVDEVPAHLAPHGVLG